MKARRPRPCGECRSLVFSCRHWRGEDFDVYNKGVPRRARVLRPDDPEVIKRRAAMLGWPRRAVQEEINRPVTAFHNMLARWASRGVQ